MLKLYLLNRTRPEFCVCSRDLVGSRTVNVKKDQVTIVDVLVAQWLTIEAWERGVQIYIDVVALKVHLNCIRFDRFAKLPRC